MSQDFPLLKASHPNTEGPDVLKGGRDSALGEERQQLLFRRCQRGNTTPTKPNWSHA